jgi:hypothetical protein
VDPRTSAAAIVVSVATATSVALGTRRAAKRAGLTAYLHWLPATARIVLPNGGEARTGYHLVLRNRGPADALDVTVAVAGPDGTALHLVAVDREEFPSRHWMLAADIPSLSPWRAMSTKARPDIGDLS